MTVNRDSIEIWNPDYTDIFVWRMETLEQLKDNPVAVAGAKEFYKHNPVDFIIHWCDTYDPRNTGTELPASIPFILFPRQEDLVNYLKDLVLGQESGLIEKARDMGATWVASAFSVWLWLFWEGSSVGWGSRKADLVDKLGDPDSIFEKLRMLIYGLPPFLIPEGFNLRDHTNYMKIVNPENSSTITGEAGVNIGRGGRKSIYFKDESAHYAHPEKIEAALADNTNVQVDISSVHGLGGVFQRRREAGEIYEGEIHKGKVQIFVMDWRDHPKKDQDWYDSRKAKAEAEGLLHVFKQEVDRDYSASIEGTLIPSEWFDATIDAHLKLGLSDEMSGGDSAALDVADEGKDKNAYSRKNGLILNYLETWSEIDTGKTTRRAIGIHNSDISIQYDCIGVGTGVKAEYNRLVDDDLLQDNIEFFPWDAGSGVQNPDDHIIPDDPKSITNKQFYQNLKAQASWDLRLRFERTFRAVTEGIEYDPELLISISSEISKQKRDELKKELGQIVMKKSATLKMMTDKTPAGMKSPNAADSVIMNYFPVEGSSTYNLDNLD